MASKEQEITELVTGCIVCGKQVDLQHCAQCKVVQFCGQEHQRKYWFEHKMACKSIGKARKELEHAQKDGKFGRTRPREQLK